MNVSVPIEKLTESQIYDVFRHIRDSFLEQDDEIGELFKDEAPKSFQLFVTGISQLTLEQKRTSLRELIEALDESDNEDLFGTEGWKHAFKMD